MARFIKKRNQAIGKAPGSLIHIGKQKMDKSRVRYIKYNEDEITEGELDNYGSLKKLVGKEYVTWVNIDGLHDIELMKTIKESFDIQALTMEDILNTDQRPIIIESENHLVIILKVLFFNEEQSLQAEQISFILGENYLLTIQERVGNHFEPVRERIRNKSGKIRSRKADYIQYALIDTLIDSYLNNIEKLGSKIESQEEVILKQHTKQLAEILYKQKVEISFIRKLIRPVKEIVLKMVKCESSLMHSETLRYWKDLEDLTLQAIDSVEIYHTMISDQFNLYQTNISNRVNDVMKVLTIFASIFIPLTFIAGIYGTNFDYVPELHFKYGYFIMLGVMVLVAVGMLMYFKRKGWL